MAVRILLLKVTARLEEPGKRQEVSSNQLKLIAKTEI